jgi:RNA polymerase sigma-70 factor (ECF subfamily)
LKEQPLIERLKNNDKKAFEEIFRRYFPGLHEYAVFYFGNSQLAEDIVQDIFLKLWLSRNKISIHTSLKGYLYRSVHNICIQYLRHIKIEQQHKELHQAKLEEAILMNRLFFEIGSNKLFESEIKHLVQESLVTFPAKTREIFELSRNSDLTNKEIAKRMHLSEKSVEYHISKVLESLRKYLKDYLPLLIIAFL